MRRVLEIAAAAAVALCLIAAPATAQDYKVIVNSANGTTDVPSAIVAKIFLKETAKFPNGTAATPVDLSKTNATRAAFSKAVVGRPVAAVETYWQQQIFSGKDVPPVSKSSDDDIIAFVKANPGGIGYVSAGAATTGVKVIDVK